MKKKILSGFLVMISILLLIPGKVGASDVAITSQTLEEASTSESISYTHSDLTVSEDKAVIYLFRGSGCSHCHEFLEYLNTLADTYGDKFYVVSYEVWNNTANASLMTNVGNVFGDDAEGVPYIVVGDKTFTGWDSSMEDSFKSAIDTLYNSTDKYDVMAYLASQGEETEATKTTSSSSIAPALISIEILNIIVFGIIVVNISRSKQAKIDELKNDIKELKDQVKDKEDKVTKVTKKVSKKKTKKSA